jgi:hypothetical protein
MLKKSSSFVLTSLKGSTYGTEYASPLRSLRPCQKAFLNILRAALIQPATSNGSAFLASQNSLSTAC